MMRRFLFRRLVSRLFPVLAGTAFAPVLLAVQVPPPVKPAKDGTLVYEVGARGDRVPDFSHAGYRGGGVTIPIVPARVRVAPVDGDDGERIQAALDYVATLSPDANGFRGAVQLEAGTYEIAGQLRISASGVVLRGAGTDENGTVLIATGTDRRALVRIAGKNDRTTVGMSALVADDYVPVGSTRIRLNDTHGLKVGTSVLIERPSPAEWLARIGMQTAPARSPFQWRPGKVNVIWERTITAIAGSEITLDAPLTTALESSLGVATVTTLSWPGRIEQVGVENLRCVSVYDATNPRDEQHAWEAVRLENVRDAWVRDIAAYHFAGSVVYVDANASRVSVQDVISREPVSELAGHRRTTFHTSGQLTLFLRCRAEDGRNDFTVGYQSAGPNVFLECHAERSSGFSGSIGSWASGALFDNISIDGGMLRLDNLESWNQGVGWAAANSVIWEASAGHIIVRSPPGATNWAVAVWGMYTGDGAWCKTSEFAAPSSLYRAQLTERLGEPSLAALAPAKYPVFSKRVPELGDAVSDLSLRINARRPAAGVRALALENGWLTAGGCLLTGRQAKVTWWRGRLEPQRAAEVGPSLTRFSPGRVGAGLTDDLEETAEQMRVSGTVVMRHNYGLWYDRRRDDHQMNKRPDADAWGPFYEQPFLRSGQGEAWDRLSRYDLTRYNPWYFQRLNTFAALGRAKGLVLINEMYFQHNVIESGAHWVDSPWRPVNNINDTGFTEPPPFTGDTIKMADEFYDVSHPVRAALHRAYIRHSLESLADQTNVIHSLSEEYTGPLHFMQFWLDVVAEWIRETGRRPLIALSATKDVQDAILADPERAKLISVVDLKYWWVAANGALYAPKGGVSLAPRQHQRLWKGGQPDAASVAGMVREYRTRFPDKAVITDLGQAEGWSLLFAGGSFAKLPPTADCALLQAIVGTRPMTWGGAGDAWVLGDARNRFVYLPKGGSITVKPQADRGTWVLLRIDLVDGSVAPADEASAPSGAPAAFWWQLRS